VAAPFFQGAQHSSSAVDASARPRRFEKFLLGINGALLAVCSDKIRSRSACMACFSMSRIGFMEASFIRPRAEVHGQSNSAGERSDRIRDVSRARQRPPSAREGGLRGDANHDAALAVRPAWSAPVPYGDGSKTFWPAGSVLPVVGPAQRFHAGAGISRRGHDGFFQFLQQVTLVCSVPRCHDEDALGSLLIRVRRRRPPPPIGPCVLAKRGRGPPAHTEAPMRRRGRCRGARRE